MDDFYINEVVDHYPATFILMHVLKCRVWKDEPLVNIYLLFVQCDTDTALLISVIHHELVPLLDKFLDGR